MEECVQNGKGGSMCPCTEEVRHASRNADSACPFLYWRDGTLGQHFVTHVVPPLAMQVQNRKRKSN